MNRAFHFAIISAVALMMHATARADDAQPYIGSWSNGRGETLTITAKAIQFADQKPLSYRDVTRATDGKDFELQITASGNVAAFGGKTLGVHCDGDEMHITGYASHAAYMQGGDVQSETNWFRDSDDADND